MTLFVTGFTPDYAARAWALADSVLARALSLVLVPYADTGKWQHNCARKPYIMAGLCRRNPQDDICWLDADCRMVGDPTELMHPSADVLCLGGPNNSIGPGVRIGSGVLLFKAGPRRNQIAQWWIKEQEQQGPGVPDDIALKFMLERRIDNVTRGLLPPAYSSGFDRWWTEPDPEPIITFSKQNT